MLYVGLLEIAIGIYLNVCISVLIGFKTLWLVFGTLPTVRAHVIFAKVIEATNENLKTPPPPKRGLVWAANPKTSLNI